MAESDATPSDASQPGAPDDAPPPPVREGQLSYADYLKVDELIGLQDVQSDPPHHDEMQFIVVHQVFELWFRLVLHETDRVAAMIAHGDDRSLREALHLLRRIARICQLMAPQIGLLDSMKPQRFLGFRDVLEPASGFQSFQFREFEFAWGLKDQAQLHHHETTPERKARLERRMVQPSVHDLLGSLLRSRGFDYPDGDGQEAWDRRVAALKEIYQEPWNHPLLEALLESLLEVDAQVLLWRRHHVSMVERMIGRKWGTGGSQGVPYLESTFRLRFFPEIWAVRTFLEKGPASEAAPE